MRKTIDFFKKYWVFILLATIATMLLFIRLSQKPTTPPQKEEPLPIFGTLPQPKSGFAEILGKGLSYKISLSQSDFAKNPEKLPVYKTKKFTKEEIILRCARLTSDLGFFKPPEETQRKDGLFLFWHEGENHLGVNVSSGQFLLSGTFPLSSAPQAFSPSQIQELIQEKLLGWGLVEKKIEVKETRGYQRTGSELLPIKELSQAEVFRLIFNPSFDSFSLVGIGPAKNLIEAKADNKGTLLSLIFNLHQADKEIVDEYPLKSFEETTKELKEGKGQIIQVLTQEGEERSIPSQDQIGEVQISSFSIVYYETVESQDFYQPVFLLKGKISLKNGEAYQASFILPAITSKYLSP